MNAIEVRGVHKTYRRYARRKHFATLKSALLSRSVLRDLRPDESFEALNGVSVDVIAGRTFGVVGRNGSGKSTLLKLIAGIGKPTRGTVQVRGRVSALIELGAGFHPEISGRENVFINGLMLGLSRREISRRFDEIVTFAELEEFIDAPVKTYSSGMYMRLGFAVAIHVDPEVLLVDEVLAVGDEAFTHKCLDKFAELKRLGKTILLVTHSLDLVERFCEEALWLDAGVVRNQGDPRRIVAEYRLDVARAENEALAAAQGGSLLAGGPEGPPLRTDGSGAPEGYVPEGYVPEGYVGADLQVRPTGATDAAIDQPEDMFKSAQGRWGTREVEITDVSMLDATGQPTYVFESGSPMQVRLTVHTKEPVNDFVFGVGVFNAEGMCCYGTNTQIDGLLGGELRGTTEVRFLVERLDLVAGTYKLDVAVHRENGVPYDYHRLLHTFRVTSPLKEAGVFRLRHRWQFSGGVHPTGAGANSS